LSVVCVVFCQVEVSARSWSLVQRSPTDCGASLCDLETSRMRRPWPVLGRSATAKKGKNYNNNCLSVLRTESKSVIVETHTRNMRATWTVCKRCSG
jgi:hypothetical protein